MSFPNIKSGLHFIMTAPHNSAGSHANKQLGAKSSLNSPLSLPELSTPAPILPPVFRPTESTPAITPSAALIEAVNELNMRSPSMPNLVSSSSPGYPPGDLHGKLQAKTPHRPKIDTMTSVRTLSASKALHQILGFRDPEPFVAPPEMPHDLSERFEAGSKDYTRLHAAGTFASKGGEDWHTSRQPEHDESDLADILEEEESPVCGTPIRTIVLGNSDNLKINAPKWSSNKQAVAVAQWYTFLDSDSDAANDVTSEHTDFESDTEDGNFWEYGSATTLAASDSSRPGSATSANELSLTPALSFPPRTSSLLPCNHGYSNNITDSSRHYSANSMLPPRLRHTSTQSTATVNSHSSGTRVDSHTYDRPSDLRRTESLPVLFPSPKVEPHSWDSLNTEPAKSEIPPNKKVFDNVAKGLDYTNTSSPVPRITVQAPSPKKPPATRKRAPSSSAEDGHGKHQRARGPDETGLPVLPHHADEEWKPKFPGHTNALLTILLTWSHTMWTLHRRLPDPKFFAVHRVFPYLVTPPIRKELVSVSLYDTSVEPHQEIRFFGPGDVTELSYHEVDVFGDPEDRRNSQAPLQPRSPVDAIKQTLGFSDVEALQHTRYMRMSQRAKTGEGRWCYLVIKGHAIKDGGTPPHLILAWHASAVTATSDCLHTIYPDHALLKATAPSGSKLKRFYSLNNFGAALRSPARFNFHQTLKLASSSSELPPVDTSEIAQREGTTMHRTVLKIEKAGSIPLIEGYRVDVAVFKDWMDACGRGSGKVIMWQEKDAG